MTMVIEPKKEYPTFLVAIASIVGSLIGNQILSFLTD